MIKSNVVPMNRSNVVSNCWVVYVVEGTFIRVIPTIHLTKPKVNPNQRCERYDNPFEAKKQIQIQIGMYLLVRVAA